MPRTPRRRVAEGIFRDRYSLTGIVNVGSGKEKLSREESFAPDTPIKDIERWRETTRVQLHKLRPVASRGTLAADVKAYLERARKTPASWKSKRSELRAWADRLGHKRRHHIKPKDIDAAIAAWLDSGFSKKTILNRCRTLHHLYVTLADDKKVRTPLDNIDVPQPAKRKPHFVTADIIKRVEEALRTGDPFVRAFFMVVASTGLRPSQVNRLLQTLTENDVAGGVVMVDGGKGGEPIPIVLNRDQDAAFTALLEARIPVHEHQRLSRRRRPLRTDALRTMSREKLYELVWSKPSTMIAEGYRVSSKTVAEVCRLRNVPVPARGYWAQRQSGHRVKRQPLPAMAEPPASTSPSGPPVYLTMDATKYARAVRAAGWPAGVRPYNARHAVGIEMAERGAEDADIQSQLGHSDLKMVRQHYTGVRLTKMARVSQLLEGRGLGWGDLNTPSDAPSSNGPKRPKEGKVGRNSRAPKSAQNRRTIAKSA